MGFIQSAEGLREKTEILQGERKEFSLEIDRLQIQDCKINSSLVLQAGLDRLPGLEFSGSLQLCESVLKINESLSVGLLLGFLFCFINLCV